MLSDLLKNTPKIINENVYEDIKESLEEIHKITLKLNEKQREIENNDRLLKIEIEFNLNLKDEKYIKEIHSTTSHQKKCLLILLNDSCIIVKNQTTLFGNTKKDVKIFPLQKNTYVVPFSDKFTHGFSLTHQQKNEKIEFGGDEELCDEWVVLIRKQIDMNSGKKTKVELSKEQLMMLNASIPTF